jgi:hypothetical protein
MARNHRLASKEFLVYTGDEHSGWRIVRTTGFVKGERLVDEGRFERLYDALNGEHIAYRISSDPNLNQTRESRFSSPALTRRDVEANAGLYGKSKTAGMSEEMRLVRSCPRTGKRLATEDFIERAIARVKAHGESPAYGDVIRRAPPTH